METILWDTLYSLSWAGRSMDKRRIHFREGFKKKYGNFHKGGGQTRSILFLFFFFHTLGGGAAKVWKFSYFFFFEPFPNL